MASCLMNQAPSKVSPGPLPISVRSAIWCGLAGGALALVLAAGFFIMGKTGASEANSVVGTLFGILGAIAMLVGTLPLRYLVPTGDGGTLLLLMPVNFALWGFAMGLIAQCAALLRRRAANKSRRP